MFIKIPAIISILSKSITLEPGDIISTGTAAGVALKTLPPDFTRDVIFSNTSLSFFTCGITPIAIKPSNNQIEFQSMLSNKKIPYLKDGDLIEMEIEKLGSIKNIVKFVD